MRESSVFQCAPYTDQCSESGRTAEFLRRPAIVTGKSRRKFFCMTGTFEHESAWQGPAKDAGGPLEGLARHAPEPKSGGESGARESRSRAKESKNDRAELRRLVFERLRTDQRGRSREVVLAFDDCMLERSHDYIQWLFRLREANRFNLDARVLSATGRWPLSRG
jgi:hypothetical protein